MSEQKPSLLIPPNGGQIPSEESKLSEEYFAKVVGTLIELVQTRKDNAYCKKEEDTPKDSPSNPITNPPYTSLP